MTNNQATTETQKIEELFQDQILKLTKKTSFEDKVKAQRKIAEHEALLEIKKILYD
jgi:hypothetical protein